MHPTIRGVAALTRVSLATVLISGCITVPLDSESPARSNSPARSPLPAPSTLATPQPAPTSHVAIHWEPMTGLDEVRGWHSNLAAGPAGFVVIQDCRSGPGSNCATAWSSQDGRKWTAHPIPAVKKSLFKEITSGRGGYVIAGFDGDFTHHEDVVSGTPTIWRSPDGLEWERVGHIGLDACCPDLEEQIDPWTVALAPSGDIVAGYAGGGITDDLTFSDPLVLGGSGDWEVVEPSAFGLDSFPGALDFDRLPFRVFSTPSEVLLIGRPCTDCPDGIWSSTDGRAWARVAQLAIPTTWLGSVATDGRHTVATLSSCHSWQDPLCGLQIWAADESDGWSVRLDLPRTHRLDVFYTGSAFVAIGESFDGVVELGSLDGSTWTELAGNGSPRCASSYAAHDDVMVAGRFTCGWWRGTVEVVPGTRTPLPTPR